jgi:hypothetical protein
VSAIREQLAALYEGQEEWSKAAQALAGIDLDSGMRLLDAGGAGMLGGLPWLAGLTETGRRRRLPAACLFKWPVLRCHCGSCTESALPLSLAICFSLTGPFAPAMPLPRP